jgi:hypothetical protein
MSQTILIVDDEKRLVSSLVEKLIELLKKKAQQ